MVFAGLQPPSVSQSLSLNPGVGLPLGRMEEEWATRGARREALLLKTSLAAEPAPSGLCYQVEV